MTYKVFVYGTLKQGHPNHGFLKSSKFRGSFSTLFCYEMISLGAFPAVVGGDTSHCRVSGELYEVTEDVMNELDRLEGNGHFYQRKLVHLAGHRGEVWMYLLMDKSLSLYDPSNKDGVEEIDKCWCWVT